MSDTEQNVTFDLNRAIEYLGLLKEFYKKHKDFFGEDKNAFTPGLFSESLVRLLFKLEKYNGSDKKYDAEKLLGGNEIEYYEIKATSSDNGTTTINLNAKPDVLIWVYFDYAEDRIFIKRKNNFSSIISLDELFNEGAIKRLRTNPFGVSKERVSITLSNVKWDESVTYSMKNLLELPKK